LSFNAPEVGVEAQYFQITDQLHPVAGQGLLGRQLAVDGRGPAEGCLEQRAGDRPDGEDEKEIIQHGGKTPSQAGIGIGFRHSVGT
jgi:hypothetical protein